MKKELYEHLISDFYDEGHRNHFNLPDGLLEEAKEVQFAGTLEELKDELGDVLWYVTTLARINGWTLSDIMTENYHKLERREAFGKV